MKEITRERKGKRDTGLLDPGNLLLFIYIIFIIATVLVGVFAGGRAAIV